MKRKMFIKTIIVWLLLMVLFSNAVYASDLDVNQAVINQYLGLIILLILLLEIIMIGLFIVLIFTYINFKKKLQSIYEIVEDRENKKNENVINIRKHNDQELLEKLYSRIDKRLDDISQKDIDN